jgi:hypothetical protein
VSGEVRDNPAESRYEVSSDGRLAGFALYKLHSDRITMYRRSRARASAASLRATRWPMSARAG